MFEVKNLNNHYLENLILLVQAEVDRHFTSTMAHNIISKTTTRT